MDAEGKTTVPLLIAAQLPSAPYEYIVARMYSKLGRSQENVSLSLY
jgi:hypothetical protein